MLNFENKVLLVADRGDGLGSLQTPKIHEQELQEFLASTIEPNKYEKPIMFQNLEEFKAFNNWLEKQGIHPFSESRFEEGSPWRIVGYCQEGGWKHGKFYAGLAVMMEFPNGNVGCYPLGINCNSVESFGSVYLPIHINYEEPEKSWVALVTQDRASTGTALTEAPRGFPQLKPKDGTQKEENREYNEEVSSSDLNPEKIHMGKILENSSTSLNEVDFYNVMVPEGYVLDGGTERQKIKLYSIKEAAQMVDSNEIRDLHTQAAWSKFLTHMLLENPQWLIKALGED